MAKKSKKRGDPSNPNTVLVLFMVFFILLSIGLGVTTYYGYAGQKKLEEGAKEATTKAAASRKAEEYALLQARLGRAAVGPMYKDETSDEVNDLAVAYDAFKD